MAKKLKNQKLFNTTIVVVSDGDLCMMQYILNCMGIQYEIGDNCHRIIAWLSWNDIKELMEYDGIALGGLTMKCVI